MDENADAGQAIFEPPPENWSRPLGQLRTTWMKNIHDDLSSLDLAIHNARDLGLDFQNTSRLSYDNVKVTINLRQTSNLQNI